MSPDALLPVAFVVGYLCGSVPFGVILTKLAGTQDLRSIGSGSIGATNVLRTGRKSLAAGTLLGDMLKGTVAVVLAGFFAGPNGAMAAGLGAFLRPPLPGLAEIPWRQGRCNLYRHPARVVLAGRVVVLRGVAVDRRDQPLLVAVGAHRKPGRADLPVVARPRGARRPVRAIDAAGILRASRKHQPFACGHQRKDRAKGIARIDG